MVTLKDGSTVEDPRLDRLVEFDEQSRNYALIDKIGRKKPRSYTWRLTTDFLIDQGREGACVGFAVANELQARPSESRFGQLEDTNAFAVEQVYWEAQRNDPWAGGAYPGANPRMDGTSVLAGIKAAQRLGYFEAYYWTFGLEALVIGLGRHGPAVLGMNWYDTNYSPTANGFIRPQGNIVGGHAILARAIKVNWRDGAAHETFDDVDLDASYVTLRNSWGVWGHEGSGDCYVTLRDLGTWLDQRGEACFVDNRRTNPA